MIIPIKGITIIGNGKRLMKFRGVLGSKDMVKIVPMMVHAERGKHETPSEDAQIINTN